MKAILQRVGGVFIGLVTALLSCGIVLGSIILSLTEGGVRLALAPASTSLSFDVGALFPRPTTSLPQETSVPGQATHSPTSAPLPLEIPTLTLPPPPTDCPPPDGWTPITLAPGDTLRLLAGRFNTTQEALAEANCLITSRLIAGSILYVPGPAPTPPPAACGPPPGWVFYTIQPGDTLYRLSLTFGVNISQLQLANCMDNATHIFAGQRIYTPFLPPVLPSHTPTIPPTTEPVPSPEPPTTTPTSTSPPPPTATPSPTPTLSPSDTPIIEETPTSTPVIEETPTNTPEVEATPTNSPPEISPVPALSTDEDVAVGPIAFTVGDLETPAGDLQVLANSSDPVLLPESNILAGGSGSDRSVTLAPAADQSGTVTITITVTDKSGSQSGTSFDLLVVPVNDAPVAQDDSSSTVQDTNVAIPALANDLDVDGDVLQFSVLSDPAHGSVQVQGDGLVYTPDPGYTGDDSFSYTVTDGILESNPATVTVTINPPD